MTQQRQQNASQYFSGGYGYGKSQGSSQGGNGGGYGNTQGGNASSGSNSWISAAVSQTSSDKSNFVTAQSFFQGGITNNQIIDSPGSTGAVNAGPTVSPQTGNTPSAPARSTPATLAAVASSSNLATYLSIAGLAVSLLVLIEKRRGA